MKRSLKGYKKSSPDKKEKALLIPSSNITMEDVDFPVLGIDNLGNQIMMQPGENYQFPGDSVMEIPMKQAGGINRLSRVDPYRVEKEPLNLTINPTPALNPVEPKDANKSTLPYINVFNFGMTKLVEHLQTKEIEDQYKRMQRLQNQPSVTQLTGYGQYGNPYIYKHGGNVENKQLGGSLIPDELMSAPSEAIVLPQNSPLPNQQQDITQESPEELRQSIIKRESNGNYKALPYKKDGKLASSAVGAYQFLWNTHKGWIGKVTGVKSKEEFRNNPKAQDEAFSYWDQTVLTPTAMKIKQLIGDKPVSINEIKRKIHFAGPAGAEQYYKHGTLTRDAFGTTTKSYELGGEYDMSEEEMEYLKSQGYEFENI